ncbi:MAG TPA: leucine-rich repeat domain-containing protein [Planctomycetaceae bacterium]|nr:leucine-rich repeat domain-containing protein [Planctomycetaceae bacterium]|tara:strand:+ start:206 stop:1153 length:948 start_codon:yes stop_codon:yes gene_type:complete
MKTFQHVLSKTTPQRVTPGTTIMRRLTSLLALATVLLTLLGGPATAQDKKADKKAPAAKKIFTDAKLEAVIKAILKKKQAKTDPIQEADLKTIFFLEAPGKEITNLSGLEKCPNLALINLSKNAITDLKPLAGLKNVQSLDLSNNKIADVTPLAKLEKLQYLQLENNQVEKLDGLAGLKKLSAVYLSNNKVVSVAPLKGLEKLSSLYLDNNKVADLGPLKGLKWVANLALRNNQVKDVGALANMTELRYTFLEGNKVTDLGPLVTMAQKDAKGDRRFAPYWNLYVSGNPLSDAAKGGQITALKKVGVRVDPKPKK